MQVVVDVATLSLIFVFYIKKTYINKLFRSWEDHLYALNTAMLFLIPEKGISEKGLFTSFIVAEFHQQQDNFTDKGL